ncbi:baseplate J/gp47 family protein [Burkholderia sp. AU19243]|uniref:baseplate J/gp47 family protein n=1 Tax=Burkholderia sp. AU19243 TaxID=2824810 RepID=UPI002011084C|nr:baseplate J/gp47 family protein [Burkholderia sp. AU19243]
MSQIPLVMTTAGPVPTPPTTIRQTLVDGVAATNPDYTANLPGGLIEDVASTSVGAIATMDQARVDSLNNVTPNGANAFVLAQLGQQFGIPQGVSANGSVYVQFSGPAGYVFQKGFLVGDGTHQYALQDGTVIQSSGVSPLAFAVSTTSGTFAIPPGTVTQLVTSVPSAYSSITVTNPQAGTPATSAESVPGYRARVMQAGVVAATGTPAYLKTLLEKITGVQARLVSIQQATGGWRVICGGGDAYSVANAILQGVGDIATLQGSQLGITGMTAANPVVISTNLASGYAPGQTFTIANATPSAYNGTYTVGSISGTTITTTRNGSGFGAYTGGAIFSPNPRNVSVSLFQNPDQYLIPFVNPPQQVVTLAVTWNTTLPSFTAGESVNQLAAPALQSYLNSIYVGQPINELAMDAVFQDAVASVISADNITTLQYAVTINGVPATPTAGTSIIPGDPEGYFFASSTAVTVTQG